MGNKQTRKIDLTRLYGVSWGLAKEVRHALGMRIPFKIYVQDPFIAQNYKGRKLGTEEIELDWEPGLMNGPTSSRVAIVDYSMDANVTAKPAEWDVGSRTFRGADDPKSVAFHQVNVWAIVQNIIAFFEDPYVMGRPIPWGFQGGRIVVLPHAGAFENAFYSRRGKCMAFGYFVSNGSPVYTCLSHDIVAHETGHAILDGIRPHYLDFCSVQTVAFHEFIADLTAILSVLRTNGVRREIADISEGNLFGADVIKHLAEEFAVKESENRYGRANKQYLRNADNETTMKDVKKSWDPYDYSEVLTGAIFHILADITILRMNREKETPKEALWKATQHVNRLAFRALDYCPPVDVQFDDFVQALLRADEVAYPVDTHGYLKTIQSNFRKRGIKQPDALKPPEAVELIWKYGLSNIATSRTAAYHFLNDNRESFDIPMNQDFEIADIYYTDKVGGGNRRLPREIILEYVWKEAVTLKGKDFGELQNKRVPLWCGGTLVFEERGNILCWSRKVGTVPSVVEKEGKQRVKKLLGYIKMLVNAGMVKCVTREVLDVLNPYQPAIAAIQNGDMLDLEMTQEFLNPTRR